MGPWGALNDGWGFSGTAWGPCSCCCSLCLSVGAQPCAPGAASPWEGRRDRCPQQDVCLGQGFLIPKVLVSMLPLKVDPQHPSRAAGKAWQRHSPSLECAMVLPERW